jgi:hypothetical protein
MKHMKLKYILSATTLTLLTVAFFFACKEDDVYPETRLFRPVLSKDLKAVGNSIIVDMGSMKKAVSYTLEISRDTFKTLDYTLQSDTSHIVVDTGLLKGDPLYWNTLYQLRATAHAADPAYDSKVSDLGNVRTERFPTILNLPTIYDVTDVAARVTWAVSGSAATKIVVYAGNDLKLLSPLSSFDLSEEAQTSGEAFIDGLTPATQYQVALYSEDALRGWVDYATRVPDIDSTAPGVVDLRDNDDPTAVATAITAAPDGAIILVRRASMHYMPNVAVNKSITIQAAYGFGTKKAQLFNKNGNWNIAGGAVIDHLRFVDLELRGGAMSATYVFNPATDNISVREVLFEDCVINTMRGIMRIRNNNVLIENFIVSNCQVDSIGSYGIFTADTEGNGPPSTTARVDNFILKNSTFNRCQSGITSRTNSKSILIESCTFSNFITTETGTPILNYRGTSGNTDVANGVSIRNSIFGPGWNDPKKTTLNIKGKAGLANTAVDVSGTYVTSDWDFVAGSDIPGFRSLLYSGKQEDLWVNPAANNFNFKDTGFSGRFSTGDPRWRVKL